MPARRIAVLLFCVLLAYACRDASPSRAEQSSYRFYQDIPGISQEDINAIESVKQRKTHFVYGSIFSSEAFLDGTQDIDGFSRLICERLGELFGIPFRPHIYSFAELYDKLDTGEVDFTGEFSPIYDALRQHIMTDSIIQRTIKVFSPRSGKELAELARRRPIRCAFLTRPLHARVKETSPLPFRAIFVQSAADAAAMLAAGTIDAYIDEGPVEALFIDDDLIKVEDYAPLLYAPIAITTADADLAPFIRVMREYLRTGGFRELDELHRQGRELYVAHKLARLLTPEEKDYISRHMTPETAVPVGIESDNYPVGFYNAKAGEHQGIAVDVLRQIERLLGLRFAVVSPPHAPWDEMLQSLEAGRIALVSELLTTPSRVGRFLWVDEAYCHDGFALLSRSDHPDADINRVLHSRVGLIKNSAQAEMFYRWFPDTPSVTVYAAQAPAFTALEHGEIDLLMASQHSLLNLTHYLEKPGFKANMVLAGAYGAVFGLHRGEGVLRAIISKAQRQIDTRGIAESWKRRVFDYQRAKLKAMQPYVFTSLALFVVAFVAVSTLLLKNRRMSKNLEGIVARRTAELELASRAKSDFLSRMSHEMRTPLNAVIGLALIAAASDEHDKMRGCLSRIESSSKHLLGIINDILDFSKIEAGKLQLDATAVTLSDNIDFVLSLMRPRAREQGQRIDVSLHGITHHRFMADSLRLNQVLLNLLANAVKFSHQSGVIRLDVCEAEHADGWSVYSFAVYDQGIGITPEQAARLFRPFEQADASTSRSYGGTGLGLVIAKSLVEAMGGAMTLASEPGQGSVFRFTIRALVCTAGCDTCAAPHADGDVVCYDFGGKRALVVDDVDINREILLELLGTTGLVMDEAANGQEAVERFCASPPGYYDVVFMDVQMPVMDGFTATRQMRASPHPDAARVVILAMTANVLKEDVEQALAAGMDAHLGKPIVLETVMSTLARLLHKGTPGGPGVA